MSKIEIVEDVEPDSMGLFRKMVLMLSKLKRKMLRRKLKKDKFKILGELIEVNRKLKILDELDEKGNKK